MLTTTFLNQVIADGCEVTEDDGTKTYTVLDVLQHALPDVDRYTLREEMWRQFLNKNQSWLRDRTTKGKQGSALRTDWATLQIILANIGNTATCRAFRRTLRSNGDELPQGLVALDGDDEVLVRQVKNSHDRALDMKSLGHYCCKYIGCSKWPKSGSKGFCYKHGKQMLSNDEADGEKIEKKDVDDDDDYVEMQQDELLPPPRPKMQRASKMLAEAAIVGHVADEEDAVAVSKERSKKKRKASSDQMVESRKKSKTAANDPEQDKKFSSETEAETSVQDYFQTLNYGKEFIAQFAKGKPEGITSELWDDFQNLTGTCMRGVSKALRTGQQA